MFVVCKYIRECFFYEFGGELNIDFDCCDSEILWKVLVWYVVIYC